MSDEIPPFGPPGFFENNPRSTKKSKRPSVSLRLEPDDLEWFDQQAIKKRWSRQELLERVLIWWKAEVLRRQHEEGG